jgi:hypothetical protein
MAAGGRGGLDGRRNPSNPTTPDGLTEKRRLIKTAWPRDKTCCKYFVLKKKTRRRVQNTKPSGEQKYETNP